MALLFAAPALAIDEAVITLTSQADVLTRRAALITQMYGRSTFPSTQATVTSGVSNPYGDLTNVARVDQYVASMSNGQSNTSLLYVANSGNNGKVSILNPGHQGTCSWPTFSSGYGIQPMLQALLTAGYSVFAMNMPACGDTSAHNALFVSYGDTAMGYFLEPAVQAMNYWDAHQTFSRVGMVGLSGGGWTTAVLPAVDPRVQVSVQIAGSTPGIVFCCGPPLSKYDDEQSHSAFYTVAGYLDLYLMGANGTRRKQIQILNQNDDCCFGLSQYVADGLPAHFGMTWFQYIAAYNATLQAATPTIPGDWSLVVDTVAPGHQISTFARALVVSTFDASLIGGGGHAR